MRLLLLIHFLLAFVVAQTQVLKKIFSLKEQPAVVEGMTFDPVRGQFYFGESTNRVILRYGKEGKPAGRIDAGKDGAVSLLGMTVSPADHQLWVCGAIESQGAKQMCVFQYDLDGDRLVDRYPDTAGTARLFNDIAVVSDGRVFLTDTETGSIYRLDRTRHVAVRWLQSDSLADANGITTDGKLLYLSTRRGIVRIDPDRPALSILPLENYLIAGIDGLYYYRKSLIGIQNVLYPASISLYALSEKENMLSKARVLAAGHPAFAVPTTGAVVGSAFYFMANSNIEQYGFEEGKLKQAETTPIAVYRIEIRER